MFQNIIHCKNRKELLLLDDRENVMLRVGIIIIIIIIIIKMGWYPAEDSFISWGEGSSLEPWLAILLDMLLHKNTAVEALQTHSSVYEWIVSTKQVEVNDVNRSWLAEQGLLSARCSRQGILVVIMRILSLVSEVSGLAGKRRS